MPGSLCQENTTPTDNLPCNGDYQDDSDADYEAAVNTTEECAEIEMQTVDLFDAENGDPEAFDKISIQSNTVFMPSCSFLFDGSFGDGYDTPCDGDGDDVVSIDHADDNNNVILDSAIEEPEIESCDGNSDCEHFMDTSWIDDMENDTYYNPHWVSDMKNRKIQRDKKDRKPWNRAKKFITKKLHTAKWKILDTYDSAVYRVQRGLARAYYRHHWRFYRYGEFHWV